MVSSASSSEPTENQVHPSTEVAFMEEMLPKGQTSDMEIKLSDSSMNENIESGVQKNSNQWSGLMSPDFKSLTVAEERLFLKRLESCTTWVSADSSEASEGPLNFWGWISANGVGDVARINGSMLRNISRCSTIREEAAILFCSTTTTLNTQHKSLRTIFSMTKNRKFWK